MFWYCLVIRIARRLPSLTSLFAYWLDRAGALHRFSCLVGALLTRLQHLTIGGHNSIMLWASVKPTTRRASCTIVSRRAWCVAPRARRRRQRFATPTECGDMRVAVWSVAGLLLVSCSPNARNPRSRRLEVGRDHFVLHGRHSIRCDSEGGKGPGRRSGVPAARAGLRRHVHSDRPRIGAADRELRDQLQSGSAHARRPPRRQLPTVSPTRTIPSAAAFCGRLLGGTTDRGRTWCLIFPARKRVVPYSCL
jgi:hypothetical protein